MNSIRSTWHHLRRSPFQTATAIIIMSVSFFALSSFAIISQGLSSVLQYFETKPEVTIFLKDGLDRSTIENIQNDISKYPNVREIKFVSKEKALEIYKDQNKNNPLLTEMVTSSILPASFEISTSDPKVLEQIASNYQSKVDIVDEIIYQKDLINTLLTWTANIRLSGLVIIIVISLITLLTIFSIIGMKITNRKEEIRISRLLGASKYYVKVPFLYEGIFYGVIGSFFGCLLSFSLSIIYQQPINAFFAPILFIDLNLFSYFLILSASCFLGTLIGYLTSWFSVKRYIKF